MVSGEDLVDFANETYMNWKIQHFLNYHSNFCLFSGFTDAQFGPKMKTKEFVIWFGRLNPEDTN